MRVWIEQELCTGDGQCADICPEVFVMRDDGSSYRAEVTRPDVESPLEAAVVEAASDCPGECIFVEAVGVESGGDGLAGEAGPSIP